MDREKENELLPAVTCGLEVHQQLDTRKLFSRMPTTLKDDEPDFTFKRQLHPVASELGEYDQASLEMARRKLTFVYQGYYENTGLVEIDEEPIHSMDEDAIQTAIEVSLLCHSKIMDNVIVMRKTVIDGSNTSGFQRTTLVSQGGYLELENGEKIGLQALALEEDSARIIKQREKEIIYRLDRLGFPLIELSTEPEIHSPKKVKETAKKIGELFRITGKVKRGLGSIRQDINISVPEGARVELKGVQDLEQIDIYVEREMQRQNELLTLKKELFEKKLTKEAIQSQAGEEITSIFTQSESPLVKKILEKKHIVMGIRLPLMKGILGKELQPNFRVGTEISGFVKAKTNLRGLLHSDELPNEFVSKEEIQKINEKLHIKEEDGFALVSGPEHECKHAITIIKDRTAFFLEGVPEETRNCIENGNSEHLRQLAGPARMYPETDAKIIPILDNYTKEIEKNLPKWANERKKMFIEKGLSEKLSEEMKMNNKAEFFIQLLEKKYDPTTSATLILSTINNVRRENQNVDKITDIQLESLLKKEKEKKILREQFQEILKEWSKTPEEPIENILSKMNIETMGKKEIESIIQIIVEKNKTMVIAKKGQSQSALMGEAMKALRGKASGYTIAELLKKEIQKILNEN